MKKSHGITLTVVAAMGMAARAQNVPDPASVPAATCQERRKAAKAAGTTFTEKCPGGFFGAHGGTQNTARGGFGATGGGNSGGG